ncbi:MAG: hypothetical protein LBR26_17140 [Prevotella sp.]|nr:hypothetical protein [Prevotella sp.]
MLPVGYIFKPVFVFGNYCPVRKYIQSSGCFFPAAGWRDYSTGVLDRVGSEGFYHSSSPAGSSNDYHPGFTSSYVGPAHSNPRTYGLTVRCVKEFIPVFYP